MNLTQTKLIGLTMELDLKAREYKILCDKLELLKQNNIDPNDEKLLKLFQLFEENHNDIVELNKQIQNLKEMKDFNKKEENYVTTDLFKKKNNLSENKNSLITYEKSFFSKLRNFFLKIFNFKN